MPLKKSAKRALRKSLKRRAKNLIYKNKIKFLIKKIKKLIFEKKIKEARELLPQVYKILDKAAKIGVIKKGAADRKKSRIARLIKFQPKINREQPQVLSDQS